MIRERLALLRELRHAGGGPVTVLVAFQLITALVPAATAIVMAYLVKQLLQGEPMTGALLALGIVIIAGRLAQAGATPVHYLVVHRVDGARRGALTRLAMASTSLAPLERPRVRELIRVARADPEFWAERTPGEGATAQLDLMMRWIGVLSSAVVLTRFAWWLAPLILLPALGARSIWRRQFLEHIEIERAGVRSGIEADHWRRTAVEWTDGKEARTFGLAGWAVDRSLTHLMAMSTPKWTAGLLSVREQWKIAAIIGPPVALAFALIVANADGTGQGIAAAVAVLGAGWAMLNLMGFLDALDIEGAMPGNRAFVELQTELPTTAGLTDTEAAAVKGPPLVSFEDVSFTYPGTSQKVLNGLDLEVRPGELLAIVGLNGAGKSTLIKLLAGLYRPTSGTISVDGAKLADAGVAGWRKRLFVVFQDFVRYQLSAVENVTLGYATKPADPALAEVAAQDAGFGKVIDGLPQGWNTPLSRSRKGGVDLSGGQWQQVVLTRAMYAMLSGADLLVLDEPTAHLDVRTEFDVFHRLAEHKGRASLVLISHRLSTVRLADRIVLLDGGRIIEAGTHDELMAADGMYAKLFTTQAERFNQGFDDRIEEGDNL